MRCKRRTRETGAAKPRTGAHSPEAHSATHGADMHPTSHPADMHSAATEVPTAEAAAMAATASERRGRKSKRRSKRTRDEATKELVVHPNSSVVELQRRIPSQKQEQPADPKHPMISNDKCDSF